VAGLIADIHGSASNDVWAVGTNRAVWRYSGQAWMPQDIYSVAQPDGNMPCPEKDQYIVDLWSSPSGQVWGAGTTLERIR